MSTVFILKDKDAKGPEEVWAGSGTPGLGV